MGFRQRVLMMSAVALVAILALLLPWTPSGNPTEKQSATIASNAQQHCKQLTRELESLADRLAPRLEEPVFSDWRFSDLLDRENAIPQSTLLVLENGRPLFWSNGDVLPENVDQQNFQNGSCIRMANGWYYVIRRDVGSKTLLALLRIYAGYAIQNQYLRNGFHPALGLESAWSPYIDERKNESVQLVDHKGAVLMVIAPDPTGSTPPSDNGDLWFVLFLASILVLMLDMVSHASATRSGTIVVLVWLARIWTDVDGWPSVIAGLELFNPFHYASGPLLNSLGDLLVTSGILLISLVFLHRIGCESASKTERKYQAWMAILCIGSTTAFSIIVHGLFTGLVLNSQIAFEIRDFFSLNSYTVAGLAALLMLLTALYLAADVCAKFLSLVPEKRWLFFLLTWVLPQVVVIAAWKMQPDLTFGVPYGFTSWLLLQALLISTLIGRKTGRSLSSFGIVVPVLVVLGIYAAQSLYELNAHREKEKRMLFARKLDSEKDRIAEFLLENLTQNIGKDTSLARFLSGPAPGMDQLTDAINAAATHVQRNYLGGYLGRYEATCRFFDRNDNPINLSGDPSWNIDALRKRFPSGSQPIAFRDEDGKTGFELLIPVTDKNQPAGTLALVLTNRTGSLDERRLPSLLLNDQLGTETGIRGYSYALYKQGKLVSHLGDFNYYQTDAPYRIPKTADGEMAFMEGDGMQHLFYRQGDRLVIVSSPNYGWTGWITLFSYLFTFFGISLLAAMSGRHLLLHGFRFTPSLQNRLQAGVLALVTFTLLLLGAATIAFFVRNYRDMQVERLYERLDELQNLTGEIAGTLDRLQGDTQENTRFALERVASSTRADFNVFSPDGHLFYTSQPGIYQQGLQAPLMERNALRALTVGQQTVFDQTEHIGELDYLSAYEPLRNGQNAIIGYLNIPFYDRETELKEDISDFLVALINLYVLLFSLALLIAFIISVRITAPLQLLQVNLRETRLGKMKPLEWKSRDEFGALVDSYNSMLDQLQRSAEMLARSEREGAWKEMARQVAHEIKNPLTPMKLGIQHLQRILQEETPDRPERINRICSTLVEQIDTLAGIASAFSDFARMPGPEMGSVDLVPILENTISLYSNDLRARITFGTHPGSYMVRGDKDQLIRIFGNLVKNGLQAIPEGRQGDIKLSIMEEPGFLTVSVTDNGSGIPTEQQKRMFIPNFTTKSGGTGLGLVMVKAMTEGMGGEVRFETEEGTGTTFFIRLPSAQGLLQERGSDLS